jgi:hypothetical protein
VKTKQFLIVIYSCKHYEDTRVRWQIDTWTKRLPENMKLLVMTGSGNDRIDDVGVLRLNCPDDYYGLIDKTQALFDWFTKERSEDYLIKVDDDVWLSDQSIEKIANFRDLYGGLYLSGSWASGPLYVLDKDVIKSLPRLRSFDVPGVRWSPEDVAVGAACASTNVYPVCLNLGHVEWLKDDTSFDTCKSWEAVFCFQRSRHQEMFETMEKSRSSLIFK